MSGVSSALDLAEQMRALLEQSVGHNETLLSELKESRAMCKRLLATLTDAATRAHAINLEMQKPAYAPSFIRAESALICRDIEAALRAEKEQEQ